MPKATPLADRFASKWKIGPAPEHAPELGPCHVWTAGVQSAGYGMIWHEKSMKLAHRVAWKLAGLDLADDVQLDHRCLRHNCVRVEHLRPVTNKQNAEHRRPGPRADNRSSQYLGVTWSKGDRRWRAQVGHNGRNIYVGNFVDEHEAGAAAAALRLKLHTHNDGDRAA